MTISATTKFIRQGLELDHYDGALAGDIVNQGDKGLLVDFGGNKLRLLGDFDYRNGEATGTIDTIRLEVMNTIDGVAARRPVFTIRELGYDAQDLLDLLQESTGAELFATLFSGNDWIAGSRWRDRIDGFDGDDRLFGGAFADSLFGGRGNDRLFGGDDGDVLRGDAGRDLLEGDGGNDRLLGGTGADRLRGETGDDNLRGDAGHDLLVGGKGNDTLVGNAGNDSLRGMEGEDVFVFRPGFGQDRIHLFTTEDSLVLDDSFFAGGRTAEDIVADFGQVLEGGILIDFGANEIFVGDITDPAQLANRIRSYSEFFGA